MMVRSSSSWRALLTHRSANAFARGAPERGGNHLPAHGGEHVIEAAGVPIATVVDHEADRPIETYQEIPGLLRRPRVRRVGRDRGEVHDPGVHLDEKQHIRSAQQHRVHGDEIGRDHRFAWNE